jgi:hypothetical protein
MQMPSATIPPIEQATKSGAEEDDKQSAIEKVTLGGDSIFGRSARKIHGLHLLLPSVGRGLGRNLIRVEPHFLDPQTVPSFSGS